MSKEGTPVMMHFLKKEISISEPTYDRKNQVHNLNRKPKDYLANMTTTAIPNHRDTA